MGFVIGGAKYTAFVQLTALPAWLGLSRQWRRAVITEHVQPLVEGCADVAVRWVDAESGTGATAEALMVSTDDQDTWSDLMTGLRDSPLRIDPYIRADRM